MENIEDIKQKKVLVRVDFNLSFNIKSNRFFIEPYRVKRVRDAIHALSDRGNIVALLAHISETSGRKPETSFGMFAHEITKLLERKITLVLDCIGEKVKHAIALASSGDILLLENVRQHPEELRNDTFFAQQLADPFDVYVNDAFSVAHRNHASVVAITKLLPSRPGPLMLEEIEKLSEIIQAPKEGKVLILGGAKISTKLPVIENFLDRAEHILVGGALANEFFKARGIKVGASLVEKSQDFTHAVEKIASRVNLPTDVIVLDTENNIINTALVRDLTVRQKIVDIGPVSADHYAKIVHNARLVIWNGPLGLTDDERFIGGTRALTKAILDSRGMRVVGGGDTLAFLEGINSLSGFNYVSTGGGAMLKFLAGEKLPGLVALGIQ